MSDPVTNIEIEDVLSSIRRLVSDEARASERGDKEPSFSSDVPPQAVELEEEKAEAQAEPVLESMKVPTPALVLTAALRIVPEHENRPENQSSDEDEVQAPETSDEPALILSKALVSDEDEQEFAKTDDFQHGEEEPVAEQHHVAGEDHDDHEEHSDAEAIEHETSLPDVTDDYQEDAFSFGTDDESDTPEALIDDPVQPVTIEDKIAALEALISKADGEFEPDGAEGGANAGRPGQSLPWEDSREPRSGLQAGALLHPDDASQTATFNETAAAFERAHSEAVETAQAEIAESTTDTLLETGDVSGVLDEEALRDMVAEIVRQELQGPLGERITRNVRKLVRREIYRALAANELD